MEVIISTKERVGSWDPTDDDHVKYYFNHNLAIEYRFNHNNGATETALQVHDIPYTMSSVSIAFVGKFNEPPENNVLSNAIHQESFGISNLLLLAYIYPYECGPCALIPF